jgi:hypothetical protein
LQLNLEDRSTGFCGARDCNSGLQRSCAASL